MKRCWEHVASLRPLFPDIVVGLNEIQPCRMRDQNRMSVISDDSRSSMSHESLSNPLYSLGNYSNSPATPGAMRSSLQVSQPSMSPDSRGTASLPGSAFPTSGTVRLLIQIMGEAGVPRDVTVDDGLMKDGDIAELRRLLEGEIEGIQIAELMLFDSDFDEYFLLDDMHGLKEWWDSHDTAALLRITPVQ